jgi:hypothetical protein
MKTKYILFGFVFALCANILTTNAQVNVQDSLTLVDLYNSTDGPNWYHHDNWLNGPVKTGHGIENIHTRVADIELRSNNFTSLTIAFRFDLL